MIKKILVSQPEPPSEKSPYHDLAQQLGLEFTFRPFIKIEGIESREFRSQKVNILDHTAIVFNSRHAIDHFFALCKELRITLPEDMKYFGISEQVILYIQKYVHYRKRKVFFGTSNRWPELITTMTKHKNEKFLIPLSEGSNQEVAPLLDAKKLNHTECVMFRTVQTKFDTDYHKDFDLLILFTPVGVQTLLSNFPDFAESHTRLACFGDATAKAIEEAGFTIDLKISGSIAESLGNYIREENAK